MRRVLSFVVAACFLVVGVFCSGVFAEKQGKGKYDLEEKFCKKIKIMVKNSEKLNLTDSQLEKINSLKLETKKELIQQKADIEILGLDVKSEMKKDPMDVELINGLIRNMKLRKRK